MPSIYVSNPTRQVQIFSYRLDIGDGVSVIMDKSPARFITIQPGRQVRMELKHISQVETVVKQLEKAGGKPISEKSRWGKDSVATLIYSPDKPVPGAVTEYAHDGNKRIMQEKSKKRRQAIAIVSSQQVQDAMDATLTRFQVGGRADLTELSAEVEMVDKGDADIEGKPVAEGLRVVPRGTGGRFQKRG